MKAVRQVDAPEDFERVKNGPVQFGDDWPGTFIRGDNSSYFTMHLEKVLLGQENPMTHIVLEKLRDTLSQCRLTSESSE